MLKEQLSEEGTAAAAAEESFCSEMVVSVGMCFSSVLWKAWDSSYYC